jgi:hypothetical protein
MSGSGPGPSDADARRAGRREANLRLLNERIADAQARMGEDGDGLDMLCECALDECDERIHMDVDQFTRLRERDDRFAVNMGHVIVDVEHVVERHEGWLVVEKVGPAADAAAEELS